MQCGVATAQYIMTTLKSSSQSTSNYEGKESQGILLHIV